MSMPEDSDNGGKKSAIYRNSGFRLKDENFGKRTKLKINERSLKGVEKKCYSVKRKVLPV